MYAWVAFLFLYCAQTRSIAATIENKFLEIESVGDMVCPEEHIMFDASTPSAVVCATLCAAVGDECRGVNFNLTGHVCLGCNTSDLPTSDSLGAPSGMVFLKKSQLMTRTYSAYTNATEVGVINVWTAGNDKYKFCDNSGSTLLPGNKLIVVDYANQNIKLFNLQTSKVTSEMNLTDPWDVTTITENRIAVTVGSENGSRIAFVNVTSVLKLDRIKSMAARCTSIARKNDKLFVAFSNPAQIQIMDLDGKVEKTIDCSTIYDFPSHIAPSPGSDAIYVTGFNSNGNDFVKRINLHGEVDAEYEVDQGLAAPAGIIIDQYGRVLVCFSDFGNIFLLTADLTKIKLLVTLDEAQSLSLDHSTGKLYVGSYSCNVTVYQLS